MSDKEDLVHCPDCGGIGAADCAICETCGGTGTVYEEEEEPCGLCGRVPCQCDDLYDSWNESREDIWGPNE